MAPAVEGGHYFAPLDGCKSEQMRVQSVCMGLTANRQKVVVAQLLLSLIRGPDALRLGEISSLVGGHSMARNFVACREKVFNRGRPPVAFLNELVDWGVSAPAEIFARNNRTDIYSVVSDELGPWANDLERRAAMLEVLRVLAGFESSWKWNAGPDTSSSARWITSVTLGPTGGARTARPGPRPDVCRARKRCFSCRNVHFALEEAQQFRHGIPSQLGLNMMVPDRSVMSHRESKQPGTVLESELVI